MCAAWSQAQDSSATEQAVAAQEQKWMQGQNNPDVIAPLLADKTINSTSEGKVLIGKDAVMEVAKGTKYTQMEYEDVKVSVFRDTAIATGGGNSKGTDPSGKPFTNHERWTDTWVKMPGGQWQCVASQSTPLKK
jgi:ketosteroid isomerase-like protein